MSITKRGSFSIEMVQNDIIDTLSEKILEFGQNFDLGKSSEEIKLNLEKMNLLFVQEKKFFIILRYEKKVIGCIDLYDLDKNKKVSKIRYIFFNKNLEYPFFLEYINLFLNHIFDKTNIEEIYFIFDKRLRMHEKIFIKKYNLKYNLKESVIFFFKNFLSMSSNKKQYILKKENFLKNS